MPCDVTDAGQVSSVVEQCVKVFGRIDCAMNCAGVLGEMAATDECTEENFDRVMRTNLRGVWLCMKYEIRKMLQQGGGAIVNMASNAGMQGTASDIQIHAQELLAMKERLNKILADQTGQTIKKITDDTDRDFFMTAEEAKKYGLIDRILNKR